MTTGPLKCNQCSADNRPDAKFCDSCGSALARSCQQCGNVLRDAAKFCDQCGTAAESSPPPSQPPSKNYTPAHLAERILASRSAMQGERKQVTVLFADLQGSMGIAERVDPEVWHQILDEFFGILGEEIHRFEGTINQYTGDGVMALFGAPLAHEDHAQRACHAALALKQRLREFGQRLRAEHGLSSSTRIGLNSGGVIVGRIGDDLRMDYTAQGHTVGLAARMENLAEPGHVYLTSHTAELVEGYFDLRPLGPMNIKGVSEPLPVFALRGAGLLSTRLQRSQQRGLSPFLGRDAEFEALQQSWLKAKAGDGQLLGVCGDGGIGKSRLCFEFIEQLEQSGVSVHRSTAVPYGAALPNLPIQTLLRSALGIEESDSDQQARQKIVGAMVMANAGGGDCHILVQEFLEVALPGSGSQLPPERRQERLGNLFAKLLPGCGEPCVLMVEDLHWLDESSTGYMLQLIEPLKNSSTLLLLNFRPEYRREQLPFDRVVDVQPLAAPAMKQLATSLLGEQLPQVCEQIAARAGGSPFYVEEAVRLLASSGQLKGERGHYELTGEQVDLVIPDTVQAILAGRIDALTEALKNTLQSAAVIGSSFTTELLQQVSGLPADALRQQLQELQRLLFVRAHSGSHDGEAEEPHWDFVHPVTQEVAYGAQLKSHRAELHAAVAAAMEKQLDGMDAGSKAAGLAHHWRHAEQWQKAGERMVEAGRFASQTDMFDAAERMRRAVLLLEKAEPSETVLRSICAAHASLVRIAPFSQVTEDEAERHFSAGQAAVEQLPEGATKRLALAELLISYGGSKVYSGQPDCAVEYMYEALSTLRKAGDYQTEANLRLPILLAYFSSGRIAEGLSVLQEQDGSAWGNSPITEENYQSRGMYANLLLANGQLERGKLELQQCLQLAEQLGHSLSWVQASLVEWAWYTNQAEGVLASARKAVQEAETFGSDFFRANAYRALISAHLMAGETSEARALLANGFSAKSSGVALLGLRDVQLATLELAEGDFVAANKAAARAEAVSAKQNDRIALCRAYLVQAEIARAQQRSADDHLHRLEGLARECGALVFLARAQEFRESDSV